MSDAYDELLRIQDLIQKIAALDEAIEAAKVGETPTETKQTKDEKVAPKKTKEQNQVLAKLRDVAGAQFQESDITFEGTKLVLPKTWTTDKAIKTILAFQEAQEAPTNFLRKYMYRPWDGAAAAERAIRTLTGTSGIGQATMSFFGPEPPQRITVQVGVNQTISVPWGNVSVPLFDGTITLGGYKHAEYGQLFYISAETPKKFQAEVNGFFDLVQDELERGSIYKGKAFTGAEEPEFLDLSTVDPAKVIYSDDVMEQLQAHLWSTIEYPDAMRAHDIPLKRSVLFHGPYGTGKTLGGMLTAQKAVAHDWTFILCRPGKDDPFEVMQTAQLYAPAVVFIEDIDTYSQSRGMSRDTMSELLDKFDGIQAKGNDILNVMTTNHEESITKGMLRPGRLDALIEISHLDLGGVTRMIHSMIPADKLADVDFEQVFEVMDGYLPAFVAESITRAQKASIVRGEGELLPLTTADIRSGAMSLRAQYNLMQKASEVEHPPTLDVVTRGLMQEAVLGMELYDKDNEYNTHEIVTS